MAKRDVALSDLVGFKGAVLVINGNQTTCEAALIDSSAAFLAASCLQYNNGKLDNSAKYELVIKMGDNSAGSQKYAISSIAVHPQYQASTYINNLAVVQFNQSPSISWAFSVGINPAEWNTEYYTRRTLSSVPDMRWNNVIAIDSNSTPDDCSKYSKVYSANSKDFLCNYSGVTSIYNNACVVPYGTVYGVVQPSNINIVALHSYSVVVGGNLCSNQKSLHYYTLLRNYAAWAAMVLGRTIGGYVATPGFKMSANYTYAMKSTSATVSGVQVFGGNRYAQDPVDPALVSPPQTTTTALTRMTSTKSSSATSKTSTTSQPTNRPTSTAVTTSSPASSMTTTSDNPSSETSDTALGNNSSGSSGSGGISTGAIVGIVALMLVLLGVGGWFYMRRKKRIQGSINGWGDKDEVESVADIPDAMRLTNDFYNTSRIPAAGAAGQGHDFGHRLGDPPAVPPMPAPNATQSTYGYNRESTYASENRTAYDRYYNQNAAAAGNRQSEYTEDGRYSQYNAGYSQAGNSDSKHKQAARY